MRVPISGRFLPLINGPLLDDLSVTSLAIHHYWRQSIVPVMDEARVRWAAGGGG